MGKVMNAKAKNIIECLEQVRSVLARPIRIVEFEYCDANKIAYKLLPTNQMKIWLKTS